MGYSRPNTHSIPNDICDKHMKQLSGSEFKVLYLIARKTCGFHLDVEALGNDKICRYTGLSPEAVRQAIKTLESLDLVERQPQYDPITKVHKETLYSLAIQEDDSLPQNLGEGSPKNWGRGPLKISTPLPQKVGGHIGTNETDITKQENNTTSSFEPDPESEESNDPDIHQLLADSERNRAIRRDRSARLKEAKREQKHSSNRECCERNRRLRETADSRLSGESGGILPAPHPPEIAPAPPVLQGGPSCIESWNANFPDRAVDPSIYGNGLAPYPLRDGSMAAQMDKVIAKVRWLLDNGGDVSFAHLVRREQNGSYGWASILAGSLDWTAKKTKNATKNEKPEWLQKALKEKDEREKAAHRS